MNTAMMTDPGGIYCRQGRTRAQMLKAEATGPNVPATIGRAVAANQYRLRDISMVM